MSGLSSSWYGSLDQVPRMEFKNVHSVHGCLTDKYQRCHLQHVSTGLVWTQAGTRTDSLLKCSHLPDGCQGMTGENIFINSHFPNWQVYKQGSHLAQLSSVWVTAGCTMYQVCIKMSIIYHMSMFVSTALSVCKVDSENWAIRIR